MKESRKFEEFSEEFIDYGIETSDLSEVIKTEELIDKFKTPEMENIERLYWIDPPFSFVVITEELNDFRYNIFEVEWNDETIIDRIISSVNFEIHDDYSYDNLASFVDGIVNLTDGMNFTDLDNCIISYYLRRRNSPYGDIYPIYRDPNVDDLSMNGADKPVFIFHRGHKSVETNIEFSNKQTREMVFALAEDSGAELNEENPTCDAILSDGSRVQMVLGDETTDTSFTIRFHKDMSFTPTDLIKHNTYSSESLAYLWLAVETGMDIVVIGGTSAGKTSTLEALSSFMPYPAKVVTAEYFKQLNLDNPNWIAKSTRSISNGEEENMEELFSSILQQRPQYIILDELRGSEGSSVFRSMITGHTVMFGMHADSIDGMVDRLTKPPIGVSGQTISSLDIVLQQEQVNLNKSKTTDYNARRNTEIQEINAADVGDGINMKKVFEWDMTEDTFLSEIDDSSMIQRFNVDDAMQEIKNRELVLDLMVENDISEKTGFRAVNKSYRQNKDETIEMLKQGKVDEIIDKYKNMSRR